MKTNRLIFGLLTLALAMAACGDSTGPRLPESGDDDEDPPSTAYHAPAQAGLPA